MTFEDDIATVVEQQSFNERQEWHRWLDGQVAFAEQQWRALSRRKEERFQDRAYYARRFVDQGKGVLFFLWHNQMPTPGGAEVNQAIRHIQASISR